jgi:hypothetical protein
MRRAASSPAFDKKGVNRGADAFLEGTSGSLSSRGFYQPNTFSKTSTRSRSIRQPPTRSTRAGVP